MVRTLIVYDIQVLSLSLFGEFSVQTPQVAQATLLTYKSFSEPGWIRVVVTNCAGTLPRRLANLLNQSYCSYPLYSIQYVASVPVH